MSLGCMLPRVFRNQRPPHGWIGYAAARVRLCFCRPSDAATALLFPAVTIAETYPSRLSKLWFRSRRWPLDTTARLLAEKLAANTKQPFIVENRPGPLAISDRSRRKAPADGYTLLLVLDTPLTVNPSLSNLDSIRCGISLRFPRWQVFRSPWSCIRRSRSGPYRNSSLMQKRGRTSRCFMAVVAVLVIRAISPWNTSASASARRRWSRSQAPGRSWRLAQARRRSMADRHQTANIRMESHHEDQEEICTRTTGANADHHARHRHPPA